MIDSNNLEICDEYPEDMEVNPKFTVDVLWVACYELCNPWSTSKYRCMIGNSVKLWGAVEQCSLYNKIDNNGSSLDKLCVSVLIHDMQ